jgi:hypothetical protein
VDDHTSGTLRYEPLRGTAVGQLKFCGLADIIGWGQTMPVAARAAEPPCSPGLFIGQCQSYSYVADTLLQLSEMAVAGDESTKPLSSNPLRSSTGNAKLWRSLRPEALF